MPDETEDLTPSLELDQVLADYVAAEEAGQPSDRQDLLARHPGLAAELREFFANRDQMQRLAAPLRGQEHSPPSNGRGLGKVRYFGDYELIEEIAAGGMGVVYKARQASLSRIVAVKMILKGTLASDEDVKRFRAEAEAAANLQHPAIVAIHEVGLHEGQHYFSMDYVEGPSLAELPRQQPLSGRQAAEYVRDAAEAVHYAHQQGTLHRDLKPSNILIDRHGRVRITDFGLAKRIEGNSDLTLTGQILGTPSYMPPEQASGKRSLIGAASDIYALGAVLYDLLTGRPPFRGESPAETLRQVESLDPLSPRLLNPAVPRDLETICLKCLEKEPRKRYGTALLLADDLGRYLRGETILARPISRTARALRWCRRNPVVAGLSAAVVSLLLAVTIVSAVASVYLKGQRDTVTKQKTAIEIQAAQIRSESERVRAAERAANDRLYQSLVNRARASRSSRRAGQRLDGLKAIEEAAELARQLQLGTEATETLRDEYIACLSLIDLAVEREWEVPSITDWSVPFDRTLTRYVARNSDGMQTVRSAQDGAELVVLANSRGLARWQRFTPDGRWLGSIYGSGKFGLWDTATGQMQGTVTDVKDFSFSSDSQIVALSCGTHVETHLVGSWEPGSSITVANINLVALHPDGERVAVTVENTIEIWNLQSGERVQRFNLPSRPEQLAWRPDGELLAAACADYCIHVRDISRPEWIALRGHDNRGIGIHFSPDGSILASHSWDGTTRLWDPLLGRELVRVAGLVRQFSGDGRRLAYDDGGRRAGIWKLAGLEGRRTLAAFHRHRGTKVTSGMAINRAGNLVAASGGDGVLVWELPDGRLLRRFPWGYSGSVQFDYQDRLVAPIGSGLRFASLHPTAAGLQTVEEEVKRAEFTGTLSNLLLSDDGRIGLSKVSANGVAAFSLAEPSRPIITMRHNGVSHVSAGLALSPDGKFAATTGYGTGRMGVKVWDTSSGRLICDLWPETAGGCVTFSQDGRWLTATSVYELRMWEVAGWKLRASLPRNGQGNSLGPVAFSRDGRLLAAAMTRRAVQLFDPLGGGKPLATIEAADDSYLVTSLAFTPDSKILAIGYTDAVDLWDLSLLRARLRNIGLDWEDATPDEST